MKTLRPNYAKEGESTFYDPTLKRHKSVSYFVKSGDAIKIGRSICVQGRLEQLRSANKDKTRLLAVSYVPEHELHAKFAEYKIRGEWFKSSDELLQWIEDHALQILPLDFENYGELPTQPVNLDLTLFLKEVLKIATA